MEIGRIKYLREQSEAEEIDLEEISEIETAFKELEDSGAELRDLPENATAGDMLDELEAAVPEIAWIIYDYVAEHFGDNEADDPSWAITPLAAHIESVLANNTYREDVRQGRVDI